MKKCLPLISFVVSLLSCATASAACLVPAQRLDTAKISAFLNNPTSILLAKPRGGDGMVSMVRDLVESDPAALKAVVSLLKSPAVKGEAGLAPTTMQRFAIGAGLGDAALGCSERDPAFAAEIQSALADAGDRDALLGYASISGDSAIASSGGGAGGSGGASGGPTALDSMPRSTSSLQTFGNNFVTNLGPRLFSGGASSSSFLGTAGNSTTVLLGVVPVSVSPH